MKYAPLDPWWLNITLVCRGCRGAVTLDSLLDAHEITLVPATTHGQQVIVTCPECARLLTRTEFRDPLRGRPEIIASLPRPVEVE